MEPVKKDCNCSKKKSNDTDASFIFIPIVIGILYGAYKLFYFIFGL